MSMILTESCMYESKLTQQPGGTCKVSGIFSKSDVRNGNGRVYKKKLWENICSNQGIQQVISERRMLGELGHPECIETTPVNVSHIITKLEYRPNGDVYGEAEILNTPSGQILRTLYEAGVKMGISSRGYLPEGSNLYPEGNDLIVPEDYELVTFDFVIDPSSPGAFPKLTEGVKKELNTILKEGKEKINPDISSFITGISEKKYEPLKGRVLKEDVQKPASSFLHISNNSKSDSKSMKENLNMKETKAYVGKLQDIITDLKDRYLTAESIIKDLVSERNTAEEVLEGVTKRYLTAEAVIKELRDYALTLESSVVSLSKSQKVSEGVIADLRDRYLTAEQIIAELRDAYTLSEQVIANIRDRYTISESVIEDLRDRLLASNKRISELESCTSTPASDDLNEELKKLRKQQEISESVISELTSRVKADTTPKRKPVPASYFEDISQKYGISISEAKETFKTLGCKKKAFEYHLEEKKKLMRNSYGEYPYMAAAPAIGSVFESKSREDGEVDSIARTVSRMF